MKRILIFSLFALVSTQLLGQSFFYAEGNKIKTGIYEKSYKFYYSFQDSLNLTFSDSSEYFSNYDSTIIKLTIYSKYMEQPYTDIDYLRSNREDSISKHFAGDKLSCIYETRFDSLDRIVYYALKNYDTSHYYNDFEWTYEYKDSITSRNKFLIQTVYVKDNYGDKRFHFRSLMIYDEKGIPKYYYVSEPDDSNQGKQKNTKCLQSNEMTFTVSNINDIKVLIRQMLKENKKILTNNKCKNLIYDYISPDKQKVLSIRKIEPYWEGGRNVIFTIKSKQ
jgi:hypothetical protein